MEFLAAGLPIPCCMCLPIRHLYFLLGSQGFWVMILGPYLESASPPSNVISWDSPILKLSIGLSFYFILPFKRCYLSKISVVLIDLNEFLLTVGLLRSLGILCREASWGPPEAPEVDEAQLLCPEPAIWERRMGRGGHSPLWYPQTGLCFRGGVYMESVGLQESMISSRQNDQVRLHREGSLWSHFAGFP